MLVSNVLVTNTYGLAGNAKSLNLGLIVVDNEG